MELVLRRDKTIADGRVWAEFNEALRVLKLHNRGDALEHFKHLKRISETLLYALCERCETIKTRLVI